MAEYKNHRQGWSNDEEFILIDTVIGQIEKGNTQRDAFKLVSEAIGRTEGAIEFHWKKIRKENEKVMERFQGAVADALIDAVGDPDQQNEVSDEVVREITKGATKIHKMIEQIINPTPGGITLPLHVAESISCITEFHDIAHAYSRKHLEIQEYDDILDYIDKSPYNAENYFKALDRGFDIEPTEKQKIRSIYDALNKIKPNEAGYMMARGMIVMMYHTIEILGIDAEDVMGIEREIPF